MTTLKAQPPIRVDAEIPDSSGEPHQVTLVFDGTPSIPAMRHMHGIRVQDDGDEGAAALNEALAAFAHDTTTTELAEAGKIPEAGMLYQVLSATYRSRQTQIITLLTATDPEADTPKS